MQNKPLYDKVVVVAGGTRGAGRGIALTLAEAGATIYVTGRSTRGKPAMKGRPETIEETADLVNARGGRGIAVQVDHTIENEVKALFERVRNEQEGKLDILVNDIWGGDELAMWDKPFWKHDLRKGLLMQERAVHTHIITSYYGVPLMVAQNRGLVIEITDGSDYSYRGSFFYSLAKIGPIHLAEAMAKELRPHHITALALTPGFLRSEAMLDHFGVTEATWKEAIKKDPHFTMSETPFYIGRAVLALALDENVAEKSGKAFTSWGLAHEYGFTDVDGRKPDWGRYFAEHIENKL
ncbi:MAG TPA: SDR family oxidoreductase [Ktedonobacteraceae bacterium]|jgi:NAD(P)-dependent dehydrogenase (short-subunit alcohol dehydrogenase family)